jgi:hypothetical protein
MNKLRKFLVIGVMVLTAISTMGIVAPVKASASAGDLIKMSGLSSVYYLGSDGKRYVFPNTDTYMSWYSDFSGVVTIPATELQSYPLGGNVVMRAGTKMVKITTDPKVYVVEPNGVLRGIGSEAQAAALFGTNWNKRIVDVSDAFFTNYTISSPLADGQIPAGSLVKNASGSAVYYYDGTNYRSIASEAAMNANRFSFSNVLTLSNTIIATGSAITGAESSLVTTSQNGGTGIISVVTGSGLMVSLNSTTPASTTIISGSLSTNGSQSIAPLTSFNLTAANDGAITVKSIKFHRIGVSSDNTLSNIYLYNGNTKLTDAGSLSNGYVTFANNNGIITVPAGQTVTVTVKADVATGMSGNIGIAIEAGSDVISTGATISGSFPINGNLMSVTNVGDLATVKADSVIPTSDTTVDAGTMQSTLWSSKLTVSQKAVKLSYVSFKQIGSVPADAIQNIKLFVNGTQAGSTASIGSDGRVNFDLTSAPILMNTGASTVELRGDVVKGSNYNYIFAIQTPSDMVLVDTNYGVNVSVSGTTSSLQGHTTTINHGSVSVQNDPSFTATQFVANQSQTILGQWTMKAYGEDIKVQTLNVNLTLATSSALQSTDGFNNVSLYVNGGQVGSSKNSIGAASTTLAFGSTNLFTIPAGTTVTLTVKGDSVNSGAIKSVTTGLVAGSGGEYQGVASYVLSSEANSSTYVLTTGSSNATASTNGSYSSQTLSSNSSKQKIGSYMIQSSSVDGVKVTSLSVGISGANLTQLSNLYIVTPDMTNGSNPINPGLNNNFSTNFTIAANQTAQVDVYADLGTASTTPTAFNTTLTGNGLGSTSNQSVNLNTATGQNITIGNGGLSSLALSNSSPVSQIIVGGTNNQAVATYNFVASTTGGVTISELGFFVGTSTVANATSTAVSTISIGGQTAAVVNGVALVSGLNLVVPTNYGGLDVPVTANFASVGLNGVADQTVVLSLQHVKYLASGKTTTSGNPVYFTGESINSLTGLSATSSTMLVAGVAPIVTLSAPTGNLNTGTVKIGSVTIVAPTGNMILKTLPITVASSGGATTSGAVIVKDASNGQNITTTGSFIGSDATIDFGTGYNIASGSVGKTFDIYATVSGSLGTAGQSRLSLGLNPTGFGWHDVNGNADQTAAYILNFPNTTVSIVN